MRLYSRIGAASVSHGGNLYGPAEDGGFDLPEDAVALLHGSGVRGAPQWETHVERQHRLIGEELERRKDPATLLDAVQQLVQAASRVAPPPVPASEPEPPPAPPAPEVVLEIPVVHAGLAGFPDAPAEQPEVPVQVAKSDDESSPEPQVHPGFGEELHSTEAPADGSEHEITNEHPGGTP